MTKKKNQRTQAKSSSGFIKTPEQIEGIRTSCKLAANTLKHLGQFVVPGVSTEVLNQEAERYIREHGAIPAPLNYKGFPKSICTSINEVICHGIPSTEEVLKEGDIVNIDVTTILNGYYGDTSTMYEVGTVSDRAKNLLKTTKECLFLGIQACRPNAHFGDIGAAILQHADRAGYSVVYQFVGHGVGLHFHEAPNIYHVSRPNTGPLMVPGLIFTIEPMINERTPEVVIDEIDHWTARTTDGGLSAQYEHSVLITPNGYEILTLLDN